MPQEYLLHTMLCYNNTYFAYLFYFIVTYEYFLQGKNKINKDHCGQTKQSNVT